jgi:hypothetical protein
MGHGTDRRIAIRLISTGVGLLLIVGLIMMAKVFMRGFMAGSVFTLVAVVCVVMMIWMRRSARGDGE